MSELPRRPRFIVWRAARGVPPGWMPRGMEGRWDYRPEPPEDWQRDPHAEEHAHAIAVRTNRIEHRDSDGASAEVWEVHPIGGNYDPDPANRISLW